MSFCYFNGEFIEGARAALPFSDLAIQRGIAVFDSIRTYGGRPFAMDRHLERLAESARLSGINLPVPPEDMVSVIREGASRIPGDSIAKPFLTAGMSKRTAPSPIPDSLSSSLPFLPFRRRCIQRGWPSRSSPRRGSSPASRASTT